MSKPPLLIVDFFNLAHRAAYSLRRADLEFDGKKTGVLYGFVSQLFALMDLYRTNRVIVCSDHFAGPTKRKELFAGYKARREPKSEKEAEVKAAVRAGIAVATKALKGFVGFKFLLAAGLEADDLIAAEVKGRYSKESEDIIIVSSDEDMYQLLRPGVSIHKPGGAGLYTLSMFRNEFDGIRPADWVYAKAIAGCDGDDVPGVRGVGVKTAVRYLAGRPVREDLKLAIEAFKDSRQFHRNVELVRLPMAGTPESDGADSTFYKDLWLQIARTHRIKLPYPVL